MNAFDCKKEESKTDEKKSASKSSGYVNEDNDTSSEAQKLESQKKDP